MKKFFFIKTKDTSRYVGMYELDEILQGLKMGYFKPDWLVIGNSDGSSYNQFLRSGRGGWVSLSGLRSICSLDELPPGSWPLNIAESESPTEPLQEAAASANANPVSTPQVKSCPQCSGKAIHGPLITWKGFQTSLVVYFMTLFTVNKGVEVAASNANAPKPEDFINNPFVQKTPRPYVPPDYSLLHFVAVLGLCIVVFLFFSAVAAKNKCETCGHRWRF